MDATLTVSHLDTKMNICLQTTSIVVPKLKYAAEGMGREPKGRKTAGNSIDRWMAAANNN